MSNESDQKIAKIIEDIKNYLLRKNYKANWLICTHLHIGSSLFYRFIKNKITIS